MFEVRVDERDIKKLERLLRGIPNAMPKVMSRGLNRTAQFARTHAARSLAKKTRLKVGEVRKKVTIQKATYSKWRSAILVNHKKIPLINFKAKQTKKGVTFKDWAQGGRVLIRHAFIATMKSGHTGVFIRTTSQRLPIAEQMGPSLYQVYENSQDEANRIYRESMYRLQKNIHDQVNLILRRRAG